MRTTLSGIVTALSLVALTPAPASAGTCYTSTSGGSTWYSGPSASYRYDGKFASGPVPATQTTLDAYVPQGLATWTNWDGTGATLLVYSAYGDAGTSALVQGVNPVTGARTRPAYVPYSHVGGIAISNGYAWIAGGSKLSRYSLSALRGAFEGTSPASVHPSYTRNVYGSSFVGANSGHLFAGRFNEHSRDVMHRYRIEPDGTLTQLAGSVEVPAKTQGVGVTTTHYFFSSSYGETSRSTMYVVRRGYGLDSGRAACFSAPTMSEGATVHNGRLYLIFESGARFYTSGSDPTNVITRLHQAPLGNLTVLAP